MEENKPQRITALSSIDNIDYTFIENYLTTGSSGVLSEEQKRQLDLVMKSWNFLRRFGSKTVAYKEMMKREGCSMTSARRFVDFAAKYWCYYSALDRDFLRCFLVEKLLGEITSKTSSEAARAKNLATLAKFIESMPADQIDPKLMESNSVFVQFNIGANVVRLPEQVIQALPPEIREQFLHAFENNMTVDEACEIVNS